MENIPTSLADAPGSTTPAITSSSNPNQVKEDEECPWNFTQTAANSYAMIQLLNDMKNQTGESNMIDKVVDRLYIGDADAASSKATLQANNITHIVCLESMIGRKFPGDFKYLVFDIYDTATAPLVSILDEAVEFIHNAICNHAGTVFVHCYAGISRSSSVVIAYLMKSMAISYDEALLITKTARPIIEPNLGFVAQLHRYQLRLMAQSNLAESKHPEHVRMMEEV